MDETLQGEVSEAAKKTLGSVSKTRKAIVQLYDYERYIIQTEFGRGDFYCMIGYWLPHENPADPVWIGILLISNPRSKIRNKVVEAFRSWMKKTGEAWTADETNDPQAWIKLSKGAAIQTFMAQ